MLLKVLLFICITLITARNIDYDYMDSKFSNIQSKPSESVTHEPDNESWNVYSNYNEYNPLIFSHLCNVERKNNVLRSNTMNDKQRRGHSSETVFTNTRPDDQNIKYVKGKGHNEAADTVFFLEDINYDKITSFTNKRRPDNDDTLSRGLPHTTDADLRQDTGVGQKVYFPENTLSDKVKTATVKDDLENRVAFKADGCASGYVKIKGKCVEEQR